jgi:hypothetical protein
MNSQSSFRLQTKPWISHLIVFLALLMCFVMYQVIYKEGDFPRATAPRWMVEVFKVIALLMFPLMRVVASRRIDFIDNQIVIRRYFGLVERNHTEHALSSVKFVPRKGRHGPRVRLAFTDGSSLSVWRRDTTNWDRLLQHLDGKKLLHLEATTNGI